MPLQAGSLGNVFIRASRPPQTWLVNRDPNQNDTQGYYLLDEWLNTTTNIPWVLVSLKGNSTSKGELAVWIRMASSGGTIKTLTGNSGGAVGPDGSGNINVVGDGTTITIAGNPGTNTLTASVSGTGVVSSIGTQDGHFVTPLAGVILLDGGPNLTTTGTVGPNTATISLSGITQHSVQIGGAGGNSLTQLANGFTGQVLTAQTGSDPIWASASGGATSFPTDSGTATPSAGVLNIKAGNSTLNSGSSVLFSGSSNNVTLNVTDSNSNTIIGSNAGNLTLTSTNSVALGKSAGHALTSGANETLIGYQAGLALTTGGNNTFIGTSAGSVLSGTTDSIYIGYNAGNSVSNSGNTSIGYTGPANTNGGTYIALGGAGTRFLHNFPGSGGGNTFIGFDTGSESASQGNNSDNTAVGQHGLNALTSGTSNTSLGYAAGSGIITGSNNTFLGKNTGTNYTGAESGNILIGNGVAGVVGESNKTKIGGIRGATTTNADAIAVLIDSAGQLGTVSSSRTKKDNIVDMGSYSDFIRKLRPVVFNYKEHSPEAKSVGLIAEEVADVAPQLVVYKDGEPETVKYHDLVPMILNELQKHCQLIAALQAMNCTLLDRIRVLEEPRLK